MTELANDDRYEFRQLATLWPSPETGKAYSQTHVVHTAKTFRLFADCLSNRPRFNTAYNSDEVRKSKSIDRNAAGAHEGTELSSGDTREVAADSGRAETGFAGDGSTTFGRADTEADAFRDFARPESARADPPEVAPGYAPHELSRHFWHT